MGIFSRGPIACGIDANPLRDYTSGIATATSTDTDHVISVVGWGTDAKEGLYWIVRNSWGEYWGEQGFVRVKSGALNLEEALRLGCSERLHGPRAQESVPLPRGWIQLQEQRVQRRSHDRCLNRDMSAISRHRFYRCSYVAVATLSCHQLRCNTLFHSPLLPLRSSCKRIDSVCALSLRRDSRCNDALGLLERPSRVRPLRAMLLHTLKAEIGRS